MESIADLELIDSKPAETSSQINTNQPVHEDHDKSYEPEQVKTQEPGIKKFFTKVHELPERHYSAPNISINKGEFENEYENEYVYTGCYSGLRSNDIDNFQNCVNLICNALDQNKGDIEFADIEIIQCADVMQYDENRPFDQAKWLYSLQNNTNNIRITEIDNEANSDDANKTKSNTSSSENDHENDSNSSSAPPYIRIPTPSPMYVPKLNLDVTHTLPTVIEIAEGKSSVDSLDSSLKSKTSAINLNNWMKQGQSVIKRQEDKSTNVMTWLSRSLGGDTRLKSASSIMTYATDMNESESKENTEANITVTKQSCHSQTECNNDDNKSFDSHVNQKKLRNNKASQTINWNIIASSEECVFDSTRANVARPLIKSFNNSWVNEFTDSIENLNAGPMETSIFTVQVKDGKLYNLSRSSTDSARSCAMRDKKHKKSFWNRFLNYFVICK